MVEALQPPLDHLLEVTPELDREDEAFEQQQRALAKPKALNKGGGMYSWEVPTPPLTPSSPSNPL
eukprot:1578057-Pyramimonas_sp.AAC.2